MMPSVLTTFSFLNIVNGSDWVPYTTEVSTVIQERAVPFESFWANKAAIFNRCRHGKSHPVLNSDF